jgi:phosphatidylglycerophosphatase GEP4
VSHVIFDKDNCITKPHDDEIVPDLQSSWDQCVKLGFSTVMIVSNSAGSSSDPLGIGAEHISRRLNVLVLAHPSKKPSHKCAKQIIDFLSTRNEDSKAPGHIMMIGDRITTDIILASRLGRLLRKGSQEAIGVLTTNVHAPERLGTRFMRGIETMVLNRLIKMGMTPGSSWRSKRSLQSLPMDWQSIATGSQTTSSSSEVLDIVNEEAEAMKPALSIMQRLRQLPSKATGSIYLFGARSISWLGAGWHLIDDGLRLGTKGAIGSPDPALRRTRLNTTSSKFHSNSTSTSLTKTSSTLPSSSRFYSTRRQPPSLPPQRGRIQGWPGAIAALVLLPTCWYGGMVLHEYIEIRREANASPQDTTVIIPPIVSTKPPSTFQQDRKNAAPPSLSSQQQQDQAPLTIRHHLQRELSEIDEKLKRLEDRMKEKERI